MHHPVAGSECVHLPEPESMASTPSALLPPAASPSRRRTLAMLTRLSSQSLGFRVCGTSGEEVSHGGCSSAQLPRHAQKKTPTQSPRACSKQSN